METKQSIQTKFRSQAYYNHETEACNPVSDEIITIPNEAMTVQEMMARAVANTLPDLNRPGYYDYEDQEDYEFDGLEFSLIHDMVDLQKLRDEIDHHIQKLSLINEQSKKSQIAHKDEATVETPSEE